VGQSKRSPDEAKRNPGLFAHASPHSAALHAGYKDHPTTSISPTRFRVGFYPWSARPARGGWGIPSAARPRIGRKGAQQA